MNARHVLANGFDQPEGLLFRHVALHPLQYRGADVLECYVEVAADVLLFSHHPQQFHREMGGIGIMQAYPLHALYVGHPLHQRGDAAFAV